MATILHNTLAGNLSLGQDAATPIYIDVSDYVTSFTITANIDEVEVPQTMTSDKSIRPGSRSYSITINYLNDVEANASLFDILYTAVLGDGYLFFKGNLFDGATSTVNPQWSGEFVVSAAETGGAMGTIGSSSATFKLVGAPTKATS